jgi:hypothetical protein
MFSKLIDGVHPTIDLSRSWFKHMEKVVSENEKNLLFQERFFILMMSICFPFHGTNVWNSSNKINNCIAHVFSNPWNSNLTQIVQFASRFNMTFMTSHPIETDRSDISIHEAQPALRRTARVSKVPQRFDDFILYR